MWVETSFRTIREEPRSGYISASFAKSPARSHNVCLVSLSFSLAIFHNPKFTVGVGGTYDERQDLKLFAFFTKRVKFLTELFHVRGLNDDANLGMERFVEKFNQVQVHRPQSVRPGNRKFHPR